MKNISSVLLVALFCVLSISAQSSVPPEGNGVGSSSTALIAMTVIGLLVAGIGFIGFIGVLVWYFLKKK